MATNNRIANILSTKSARVGREFCLKVSFGSMGDYAKPY